ncbi:MAG: glycosyltransferase family 2 protein, partial [Ignavibacteriales bacterium]
MLSAKEYPMVSVVIATYNCSSYITRAVQSALDQTYPNVEVIVIDDGSTDNTPEILQSFRDRIRVVFQENRGPAAARNAGLAMAGGKYVAILDADDYWLPERLEKMISVLEDGPYDLLISNFYTVDEYYRRLTAGPAYDKLFCPPYKDQYKDILWRAYAFAMTVGKSELFRSQ